MKINSITSYRSRINLKSNINTNKCNVSFGFGEDYGTDPFINPEFDNPKKQSTWGAIKAIFGASIALGSELLGSDKARLDEIERIGIRADEMEKLEALRAKNALHHDAEADSDEEFDFDDDDDDDISN